MRDDRERLLDMLEAIQKIEQYADDETFSSQNENLVEVWMIHHLQITGTTLLSSSDIQNSIEPTARIVWATNMFQTGVLFK